MSRLKIKNLCKIIFITFSLFVVTLNQKIAFAEVVSLDDLVSGLKGRYYEGNNFNHLRGERVDTQINFKWKRSVPHQVGLDDINQNPFSVRWQGYIIPSKTTKYRFNIRSNGGVRLFIDNDLIIDKWSNGNSRKAVNVKSDWVNLIANEPINITLEYVKQKQRAAVSLSWKLKEGSRKKPSIIPASVFRHQNDNGTGDNDDNGSGDNDDNGTGDNDDNGTGDNDDNGSGDNDDNGSGDNDDNGTGDNDDNGSGDNDDNGTGDNDDNGTGDNDDNGTGDNDDTDLLRGLKGYYFEGESFDDFRGERIDQEISFNWGEGAPANIGLDQEDNNEFSIRWRGYIKPLQTGDYHFYVYGSDGVRLYVDGHKVINRWVDQSYQTSLNSHKSRTPNTIQLMENKLVPIVLEYYESKNAETDARIDFMWSQNNEAAVTIPGDILWHSNNNSEPKEQRRLLTMVIDFNNLTADFSIHELNSFLFNQENSVKKLFEASSDNKITLSSASDTINIKIDNGANSCSTDVWANSADDLAIAQGYELNKYEHRIYVLPSRTPCNWAGLASIGGKRSWIRARDSFIRTVIAHELGHNLGMGHSGHEDYLDNSATIAREYGDHSGFMGNPSNPYKLIAPQRDFINWFDVNTQIKTLSSHHNSETIITLTTMDDPDESKYQVIKIPVDNGGMYYISYRTQHPIFGMSRDHDQRVHIHYLATTDNYSKPLLRAALSLGEEIYISESTTNVVYAEGMRVVKVNGLGAEIKVIRTNGNKNVDISISNYQ